MSEKEKFALVVIGGGPGGYVAAIRGAQMGKKIALIEQEYLGGTCLNVGCIPSKTLLSNAEMLKKIKHAEDYGISLQGVTFSYAKMKARKDQVVSGIKKSLEGLIRSNGITIIRGRGELLSPTEIKIKGEENRIIEGEKIIIATGSLPIDIPSFPCDHNQIRNSTSILELTELPKSLAIIGGGYIGCEFASLFATLDVKVTIIEALSSIVQTQGHAISTALTHAFNQQGITMLTNTSVKKIDKKKEGLTLFLSDGRTLQSEMVVVSVGRRFNSAGLGLEKAGVLTGPKGNIEVNEKMETNIPGIYAIGDVTGKMMLAHVASHQGMVAASNALGRKAHLNYTAVPAVIFTDPEIASVGLTAEQAKEKGWEISVGRFPFQALGKSQAAIETEGFVEVVSHRKTGEILGAQVVGHNASALIAEMTLAINNELTLDCVIETIHAHPTLPEACLEAALLAKGTPIHFPPKIKSRTTL